MELSHTIVGEGARATILLHGFLGSGRNLASLARALVVSQPDRRVLLPDLTGHGESGPLPEGADLETLAADVVETALRIFPSGPRELLGHSLGGRVGLTAAAANPGFASKLTMLDIAPGSIVPRRSDLTERTLEALLEAPARVADRKELQHLLVAKGLPPAIAAWLGMNLVADDGGYRWRIEREALTKLHAKVNARDLWSLLENRSFEVRVIRGGKSRYVSDEAMARLEALGCETFTIEDAGHFVHVDAPDELLQRLVASPRA